MRIDVQFDTSALKVRAEREIKRLAYNTALALNETAKATQLAERANLDRKFTIRKATFMYRLIKIFKFASARQGQPYAEFGVDPTKSRVLLGLFEQGGVKKPVKGKNVAVPVTGEPARPTFQQSVVAAYRFTALRLHTRRSGRRKKGKSPAPSTSPAQFVGKKGSGVFQIAARGVFQRIGKVVRAIYLYVRRPRLDRRLDFLGVAKKTILEEWPKQFKKAYRH